MNTLSAGPDIACPAWCTLAGTDHNITDIGEYAHVGDEAVIQGMDGQLSLRVRQYVDADTITEPYVWVEGGAGLSRLKLVQLGSLLLEAATQTVGEG
jgi:hypothetical protein